MPVATNASQPQLQAVVFEALADSTRRLILMSLGDTSKSATTLSAEFPLSRQAVLKHLTILAEAGLINSEKQGKERMFALNPGPLKVVSRYVEDLTAKWDRRLGRLKHMLESESLT